MNKYLWSISIIILLTVSVLSGCNTQEATEIDKFEGIRFESTIVELVNASLDLLKEKNVIRKADVKYLFHNIAVKSSSFFLLHLGPIFERLHALHLHDIACCPLHFSQHHWLHCM